jgi:hypothetical protein
VTLTFGVTEDAILTVSAVLTSKSGLPMEVPVERNPWLHTREELLELVTIDSEKRRQDDIEADQADRRFARDVAIRNIESYIRNAERAGTEFARSTTSMARQAVVEAARRLPETPRWVELDRLRTLFNASFGDFVDAHPQEFPLAFWGR